MSFNFMYIHLKSVYWQVITEPGQVAWEHGFAFPKIESLKPEWRGTPMNYKFKLIVCVCVYACAHVQVGKEEKLGGGEENALLPLSAQGKINQHRRLKNVKGFSHSPRFPVGSLNVFDHARPPVQPARCSWCLQGSLTNLPKQLSGKLDTSFGMSSVLTLLEELL